LTNEIRDGLLANPPDPADRGGSANVVRTGEAEILLDLDADPSPLAAVTHGRPTIQPTVDLLQPKSLVYMPLKARGEVLGVLALIRTTVRFDERDVETVRELAARAAVAVDNANLYREAERGRERLGFLAEASALLGSTLDVDATLEQLGSLVAGRIAERCTIHLLEPSGELRLATSASSGAGDAEVESDAIEDAVLRVLADGQPVLLLDVGSAVVVPLIARGGPVGALSLIRGETLEPYTEADVELAVDVARRAAIALDNARLFHAAEERAQAARVLASVGDGVFLVDVQGIVRTWNRAATTATGLRAEAVVDRPAVEAIPGWSAIVAGVPVAAAGSGVVRAESLPLDLGGRELWLSLHGVAVPDGIVYAFRDLTEERALEAMRTEFVSTVSHELRTPLAAIYGAAMTLRRSDVALSDEQRARLLDVVSAEADRLARTVNDILWASRLDAGSLHVSIQSCDPVELVQAVVEAQRAHLDRAHEISLTSEDDLPPIVGDPDKVGRVLINLVDNAIKYSPDGGNVEVQVRQSGGRVRFSIVDAGLGIPPSEQRRIFEKFYRLDPNMTRGVGGTGLGLYICRELLRRMDGRIWVDSAGLGKGSAFHIELPVAAAYHGV
jgi:PAS domain S-box-containing protein